MLYFSFEYVILYISALSFDPPVFQMMFLCIPALSPSLPSCVEFGAVVVLCVIVLVV